MALCYWLPLLGGERRGVSFWAAPFEWGTEGEDRFVTAPIGWGTEGLSLCGCQYLGQLFHSLTGALGYDMDIMPSPCSDGRMWVDEIDLA